MAPLPIVGGAYADEAKPWSVQDVCNWLPTQAESEGTRTPSKYATPPGLKPYVEAGSGVVRGLWNCNGKRFAVIGTMLYQIGNTGVAIPRGTIPGVGRVSMAHNQITGGNELLVVNGSAGYVWNTVEETLTKITDPGFPGSIQAVFIDGYLLGIEPGRRYAFNSDLSDAMNYNTLDRFASEVNPDPLVGMAVSNNELFLLSTETGEFYYNAGNAQQPFRSKRIFTDKGCAGSYTIATLDNTVLWLGNDGKFYKLAGYSPQRISNRPIEQAIRGLNWSQAFAFVWDDSGHTVCYWTFPDGQTWGWDASTGQWHRRKSYGLERWRINSTVVWNQKWYGGDFQRGRIWEIDWDYQMEGDQYIERIATTGVTHDNQTLVQMPRLEVIADMGQEETTPIPFPEQPEGPSISGDAPDGALGVEYAGFTYTTTEGDAPIESVTLVSGALPPGLSFDNGVIDDGTPTTIESYTFTIRVTDTNGLWAEHTDTIQIVGVSFATITASPGHVMVSETGITWSGDIDTGLGDDIVLLKALGGNVYALGDGEGRYSSDHGVTWNDVVGLETGEGSIEGMGYADGVWIITYNFGDIISRSTDGVNFEPVTTPTSSNHYSVAASGDRFVIGLNNTRCRVSNDKGLTWALQTVGGGGISDIAELIFAHDRFYCVSGSNVCSSPTAQAGSWTVYPSPSGEFGGIRLMALGDVLVYTRGADTWTSLDHGATWTQGGDMSNVVSSGGQRNNITHNGFRFIVAVLGAINTAENGTEWIVRKSGLGSSPVNVTSLGEVPA